MFASKLLSGAIPPLKNSDQCGRALIWMDEFRVNALPLTEGKKYLGMISKSDLAKVSPSSLSIEQAGLRLNPVFVFENQHVYDLVRAASQNQLDLVPVLNEKNEYSGIVTVNDIVRYFAESKSVYMPGGIIVVEIALKDYSLSQISQIIESDAAHILSTSLSATSDPQVIELTIKVDKVDISRILAALFRYNYNVTGSYHQSEHTDDMKNRYESLMHYLSIG